MGKWVDDIVLALQRLGGEAPYYALYDEIERIRPSGRTKQWKATVRRTIEMHSSDSDNYRENHPNLFYSPQKGSGVWGLRTYIKPSSVRYVLGDEISYVKQGARDDQWFDSGESIYSEEGGKISVIQTRYERNSKLRNACLQIYGYTCSVCDLDMKNLYGILGEEFIHVHHLHPLHLKGRSHKVDPRTDLRPVCPNCHAMLHQETPPISIDRLRKIVSANQPL